MNMNQRGFANIILIGVVIVVLVIIGYFVFTKQPKQATNHLQQNNSNIQEQTKNNVVESEGEIANWKIYTNIEYKYRVSYPPDWELGQIAVKQSPAAVRFTKITKQGDKYINDVVVDIIVEPNPFRKTPTEEWYREWVKQIPTGINLEGVKIEETTFKNLKALKIDNNTIFFAKGFNMFRIKWHVAGNYDKSLAESSEKIFEKMSATFAFFD